MLIRMRVLVWLRPPSLHRPSSTRLFACSFSRPLQHIESHMRCPFTTSSGRLAVKKSRILQSTPKSSLKSVLPYKSLSNAYMEQLAKRVSPTLLYEAPSHAFHKTAWFLLGGFCLTWAIINFNNHYLHPMEGTPVYVPYVMSVACVGMALGAGWSFLKVGSFLAYRSTCSSF